MHHPRNKETVCRFEAGPGPLDLENEINCIYTQPKILCSKCGDQIVPIVVSVRFVQQDKGEKEVVLQFAATVPCLLYASANLWAALALATRARAWPQTGEPLLWATLALTTRARAHTHTHAHTFMSNSQFIHMNECTSRPGVLVLDATFMQQSSACCSACCSVCCTVCSRA